MNHHTYFSAGREPVDTCIVGTGDFGRSFLAQGRRVPLMRCRIAIDLDASRAAATMHAVGIDETQIRICADSSEAKAAWKEGAYIAADDLATVINLPFQVLVEATGHPEGGARYCRMAIEAGRHVALVSKEVDSVVGPGLDAMARRHGRVVTPVDGDQPSLLIGLVTWAETLGLEILSAGKSSEYDYVYDPATETIASNGRDYDVTGFSAIDRLGDRDAAEIAARRSEIASALSQRIPPDACELTLSANGVGFGADKPMLHAPIARIDEVPSFLSPKSDGGLLSSTPVLDVFHCLRGKDEISFAGGVFVVVRCNDQATWAMLQGKGHVLSRNGRTAMLYLPRHLLGLEAATSILEAALHGVSTGATEPRHHTDLVACADIDLEAGTILQMGGHHHEIPGVSTRMVPAGPIAPESPVPFYLAAHRKLVRPVGKGDFIVLADLEIDPGSELLRLRQAQDAHFFGEQAQ
ncbi:flagellar biosynthesis protein FlgA [Halomonas sp. TRM85114]|uniref:NAD(P)H-dependent oxidoreductase n=1 Tax=Halomonas jincaotanensis TaxID=2810616 RepID=UPI001BD3CEEA|nr:flagellar biosynthesis protein FlgA [Halomonas jincaotanensis]MBS9404921.1 flagellar biosynthesis protein FlgA [Halomonas jincaotanensis]